MNTTRVNRLASLAALTTVAALYAASASAAPKAGTPIFNDRAAAKAAELPGLAKKQSGVVGTLNSAALSAASIELTLADGQAVTASLQRVVRDDAKGTQSWIGTFDDSPGSILVLSKAKGVVTGFATYKDQTFEVRPASGGKKHVLFAVDLTKVPAKDGVANSGSGAGDALAASDYGTGGSTLTAAGAVVQDIVIFYTSAAAASLGQAGLESNIQSAVQAANQAYINSNVNVTLNLVGVKPSPVSESGGGMQSTLYNFKTNSTVRSTRDQLAADMAVLISQDSDWCGYANLDWQTYNGVTNWDAYAVVYTGCLNNQTLAHEVGHLQGLDHNRENATGYHDYAYAFGYRQCVSGGFMDVMSYACPSIAVPRISNFSNPAVAYNGYPTGISYESNPSSSAESARALNNSAAKVAGFRAGTANATPTAPAAPSALASRSVAYNAVTVGWTDNSGNETGFKLERSSDGVNFTEIATLGTNATSATDNAVVTRATYYYRVRAYNSVGVSAYSNTVSVTTPDAPPAAPVAPSSVVATNNADGSARVAWVDASSNESGFEVRRETLNTRKNTWGSMTTVGTVSANLTSLIDVTGAGTFRYTVRAVNAGGGSAYAGPAQVTVTKPSTKRGKAY